METSFRICLVQATIGEDFVENMDCIQKFSKASLIYKPNIIVLPSFWTTSNLEKIESKAQEENQNEALAFLKSLSIELGVIIVGGSILEKEGDKIFNTCYCLNGKGEIIDKHRQMHYLGDSIFSKGNQFTTIELPFVKIGIGLNEDLRFMEYSQILKSQGAQILIFPSKYSQFSEYNNYNIIMQGRALDNNAYIACCNAVHRDSNNLIEKSSGFSQIIDPYGQFLISSLQQEGIVYAVIDKQMINKIEEAIPTLIQKKSDLYSLAKHS